MEVARRYLEYECVSWLGQHSDELVEDAAADHGGGGVADDVRGASLRCAQR